MPMAPGGPSSGLNTPHPTWLAGRFVCGSPQFPIEVNSFGAISGLLQPPCPLYRCFKDESAEAAVKGHFRGRSAGWWRCNAGLRDRKPRLHPVPPSLPKALTRLRLHRGDCGVWTRVTRRLRTCIGSSGSKSPCDGPGDDHPQISLPLPPFCPLLPGSSLRLTSNTDKKSNPILTDDSWSSER